LRSALSFGLLLLAGLSNRAVAATSLCGDVILTAGSDLRADSPLYDVSGLRYKLFGKPSTLQSLCKLSASQASNLNVRLYVQGASGRRYQARQVFSQAATAKLYVDALKSAKQSTAPELVQVAATPPVGDAWTQVFAPQYQLLSDLTRGTGTCASETVCSMHDALAGLGGAKPLVPGHISLPMGQLDRDGKTMINGATIDSCLSYAPPEQTVPQEGCARAAPASSPSPAPASGATPPPAMLTDDTTVTLYINRHSYEVVDLRQKLMLSDPLDYVVATNIGTDLTADHNVPSYENYQLFSDEYKSSKVAFTQSATQGKDFNFCPLDATLPIPGSPIPLTAKVACTGKADIAEQVDLSPTLGYFLVKPNVEIKLEGTLQANGGLIVGTVSGDVTIASFSGGAGGMYGTLADPLIPGSNVFAYRQFAYYDANAFAISLTATIKTVFGAKPFSKTFTIYKGFSRSLAPRIDDWQASDVVS
jgi:hypothetical protein